MLVLAVAACNCRRPSLLRAHEPSIQRSSIRHARQRRARRRCFRREHRATAARRARLTVLLEGASRLGRRGALIVRGDGGV